VRFFLSLFSLFFPLIFLTLVVSKLMLSHHIWEYFFCPVLTLLSFWGYFALMPLPNGSM
jgi:hypothetical protein